MPEMETLGLSDPVERVLASQPCAKFFAPFGQISPSVKGTNGLAHMKDQSGQEKPARQKLQWANTERQRLEAELAKAHGEIKEGLDRRLDSSAPDHIAAPARRAHSDSQLTIPRFP